MASLIITIFIVVGFLLSLIPMTIKAIVVDKEIPTWLKIVLVASTIGYITTMLIVA